MTHSANPCEIALKTAFIQRYPEEAAFEIEKMSDKAFLKLSKEMPIDILAIALNEIPVDNLRSHLLNLPFEVAHHILVKIKPELAAKVLVGFDDAEKIEHIRLFPSKNREDITEILKYPPQTAGSLMDPLTITFRNDMTAIEAIELIKKRNKRGIRVLFIVDAHYHPVGMIPIQKLAMADDSEKLLSLCEPISVTVPDYLPQDELVEKMEEYKMTDVPVVDINDQFVGVISLPTLLQATQEEYSKDIQTMVGVSEDERARSNVMFAVRRRLPWLMINLFTCFLAAGVVDLFENTIAKVTALAVLMPIVAGQAGNTGAQALGVTMRGLALKEVRFSHWFYLVFKELRIAMLTGISVALVTSLGVGLWSQSLGLSVITGVSMVISMLIAGISGAAVPLILAKCGQDPASSSSIILTTVTDVCGFLSFLGIATCLIKFI